MAAVVMSTGLADLLRAVAQGTGQAFISLRLFSNNQTPAYGQTSSDYTQCTFNGYGAQSIAGNWGSFTPSGSTMTMLSTTFSFIAGSSPGPEDVYGYYIVDGSGVLVAAERGSGVPFTVSVEGDQIDVTLTVVVENHP